MSNFNAIHRITCMEGTLKCTCEHEAMFAFVFLQETDGDELEEIER